MLQKWSRSVRPRVSCVACVTLTDGDVGGAQRQLLSPLFARHSAPSRIGRSHLPPPSDVIPPPTAAPPSGRQSNTAGEVPPSAVSPVAGRRASAPRPDVGLPRRTHKAKPGVVSPADRGLQHSSQARAGCPAAADGLPETELVEDGFVVRDFHGHVTDSGCRR